MELLLNLIWITLAAGAFLVAMRRRHRTSSAGVPNLRFVLALACMLLLLFPIVSASDDLHPTQAVLEDSSRRIQHLSAPIHISAGSSLTAMLPLFLTLFMPALALARPTHPVQARVSALEGHRMSCDGRAPPLFGH